MGKQRKKGSIKTQNKKAADLVSTFGNPKVPSMQVVSLTEDNQLDVANMQEYPGKIDYSDIAKHGIVEVVGDDKAGRKIIVVSACKLPSNKSFDSQRFLR